MSDKFILPEKIFDQHMIMLGKTGAGKSSKLRVLVEHLVEKGKRVCVVDPKGDWWGVKLAADGKSPGLQMILFGDFKKDGVQDVPINDQSGKHIAELITAGNRPCVIGMRGWTNGAKTRFWIDFASTLFNRIDGEFYLVGDEFHNFAPKQWRGRQTKDDPITMALHWSNTLLSEARGLGLTCLLASQRPQKVHNDTLTSCETLAALRVTHPRDREAVQEWIDGNGDPDIGKEVLNTLATMPRTDGWIWSPEIEFGPKRITFPMFQTFDSFAPPQLQKRVSNKGWADVDLDAVKEKLATVIKEHEANDPKALKSEVARLRGELMKAQKQQPAPAPAKTKTVEKFVLKDGQLKKVEAILDRMGKVYAQAGDLEVKLLGGIDQIRSAIKQTAAPAPATRPVISQRPVSIPRTPRPIARKPETSHEANGEFQPNGSQQRVLNAIAWFNSIGVEAPSKSAVGLVAKIKPTGGHFSNTMGPLSTNGLIRYSGSGDGVMLTDEGSAFAVMPDVPPTLDSYHHSIRAVLAKKSGASVRIFDVLRMANSADVEIPISDIGTAASIDPAGGHFSNSIGPLGTLGLIERRGGMVRPTELMFPPALMEASV